MEVQQLDEHPHQFNLAGLNWQLLLILKKASSIYTRAANLLWWSLRCDFANQVHGIPGMGSQPDGEGVGDRMMAHSIAG